MRYKKGQTLDVSIYRSEQWEYTASSKKYNLSATGSDEQSAELRLLGRIVSKLEKKNKDLKRKQIKF